MGAGIISGWQSLVFAQPPPGEDVGPLCPQWRAARVTRGQARHMARSGRGQGGIFFFKTIIKRCLEFGLMIMMMISTHSELLSLPQYTIFPAPLWNIFWLFPPGDRGQLGHWGPLLSSALACEGRADCSVSWSHLSCELTVSISMKPRSWSHSRHDTQHSRHNTNV